MPTEVGKTEVAAPSEIQKKDVAVPTDVRGTGVAVPSEMQGTVVAEPTEVRGTDVVSSEVVTGMRRRDEKTGESLAAVSEKGMFCRAQPSVCTTVTSHEFSPESWIRVISYLLHTYLGSFCCSGLCTPTHFLPSFLS